MNREFLLILKLNCYRFFNFEKGKREAAAQRRPARSERKNRAFSAKRQAVWFGARAVQTENALNPLWPMRRYPYKVRHARIPARHSTSHKIYKIPENAAIASRREEHSDSQPTGVFCVQKIRIRPAGCRTNSHIFMTSAAERNLSPAACMGRTQPDRPFSFSFRPPRLRDALPCGTDKLFSKSVGQMVGQICPTTKKPSRLLVRA